MIRFFILFMLPFCAHSGSFEYCKNFAELSESIMHARQSGVDMVDLLIRYKETVKDEGMYEILESISIDAYKKPRYQSEQYKVEIISEYKNKSMSDCMSK